MPIDKFDGIISAHKSKAIQERTNQMNENYVIRTEIIGIRKRLKPSKHYTYEIVITWSDQKVYHIFRRYSEFFELQCELLNIFGEVDARTQERVLPFLPGKILLGRSHIKSVALMRLDALNEYCKKLISLPANYSKYYFVLKFFRVNTNDIEIQKGHQDDTKDNHEDDDDDDDKDGNSISDMSASTTGGDISTPLKLEQYHFVSDYKAKSNTNEEFLFRKTMRVNLIKKHLNGWCWIEHANNCYWIPYSYMKPVNAKYGNDLHQIVLQKAESHICTKNYTAARFDELTVEQGAVVDVLEKNFNGWWKVRYNGQIGIVPALFLSPCQSTSYPVNHLTTNSHGSDINSNFNGFILPQRSLQTTPDKNEITTKKPMPPPIPPNKPRFLPQQQQQSQPIYANIQVQKPTPPVKPPKPPPPLPRTTPLGASPLPVTAKYHPSTYKPAVISTPFPSKSTTTASQTKPQKFQPTHVCTETYRAVTASGLSVTMGEYVMWIRNENSEEMRIQNQNGQTGVVSKYILDTI